MEHTDDLDTMRRLRERLASRELVCEQLALELALTRKKVKRLQDALRTERPDLNDDEIEHLLDLNDRDMA